MPAVRLLLGPYLAACLLLGVAGTLKAFKPSTTTRAMRDLGLPTSSVAVRAGGALEAALAVGAALVGGWSFPILVGVSYVAFTSFVLLALQRGRPLSSCGCFGGKDTPPTEAHVAIDAVAAAVAFAWAAQSHPDVARVWSNQPAGGIPLVLLVIAISGLTYLVLTELPRARLAAQRSTGQ
jgi:hypothetical protein